MYQLTGTSEVVRLGDRARIPADPGNLDFAEYQAWRALGNEPEPASLTFNLAGALQRARDVRTPILNALVGIGLAAQAGGDAATVSAVLTARQGLLDITKLPALLAAANDDAFDAIALERYRELAAAAPAAVRSAFLVAAS